MLTLKDVFEAYKKHVGRSGKRHSVTQADVAGRWFYRIFGEEYPAADLGMADIQRFVEWRLDSGTAVATVNSNLRQLRAAMRLAEEYETLRKAPKVRLLREERCTPEILTEAEVKGLLDLSRGRARLVMMLGVYAGLRHGEIAHLQRRDVDFVEGVIRVRGKDLPDGTRWSPKSHHERAVPLASKMRPFLEAWMRRRSGGKTPDTWLFPGPDEKRPQQSFGDMIRRSFVRAGLYIPDRKPGLHMLRRTFASRLLAKGADIETVRDLMGHRDLLTTQRYIRSTPELKRNAVEAL